MALCMSSSSIVTNFGTRPNNAIQSVDVVAVELASFAERFTYLPSRHHRKRHKKCRLLELNHREIPVPRTLAFAAARGNDEAERGGSFHALSNDIVSSEGTISLDFSESELDFSRRESEACISGNVEDDKASVLDKLKALQLHILASEQWNASRLRFCDRKYLNSATNIIHYLALKSLDIGQLNNDLTYLGLSSLEKSNLDVLDSLNTWIQLLQGYLNRKENIGAESYTKAKLKQQRNKNAVGSDRKAKALSNEELLLGNLQEGRSAHIMVTVGKEAIESETLLTDLLRAGASIIRINCAHGDPSIWGEIIRRVRSSSQMLEIPCRVLMDLAGPKLRTGPLKPGPCVIKVSPKKDAFGNVILPAQVWLSLKGACPPPHLSPDAAIFVQDKDFLVGLQIGDSIRLCDARGKKRTIRISKEFHVFSSTAFVAECFDTAYIQSGTKLYGKGKKGRCSVGQVVDVPPKESFVRLKVGDLLVIARERLLDETPVVSGGSHRITCSSGYLFDSVKPGESISFDDGKLWGIIQGTSPSEIVVSITHAGLKGTKLGSEKSINIPQSNIRFEGLTSKDLKDLEFVASHADMVGISFIRDVCDITLLQQELKKRKIQHLGIVLKIETQSGYERLPLILLEAMKCSNPLGVMIARGDLAVECGWERLAYIQEEIMAMCKAAQVPVIWATQVLESLVKSGVPTRAEITDAAYAKRASCVMLNKGKHIVEAVSALDTILHAKSSYTGPELRPILLSSHLS